MRTSGRLAIGLAGIGLAAGACNRIAEEPASQAKTASSSVVAVSDADARVTDRCVAPTSSVAPPPVAPGPAPGCPADPNPHTLQTVTVKFPEARDPSGAVRVTAELARRPQDTERGLMYRTKMAEDHGMLFDLGVRQVHSFWMHNTCIPLDMLFLDDDGFIVGILENVPTLNDAPRSVPCLSTHVLEMNAGWSRRHGVRAGDRAGLPGA